MNKIKLNEPIKVTIPNWKKYNKFESKRLKNPSWFALSNKVHLDPEFYEFTAEEFRCWICVMCECSMKNLDSCLIIPRFHADLFQISVDSILSCLFKLKQKHIVTYDLRAYNAGMCALQDKTRQDITIKSKPKKLLSVAPQPSKMANEFFNLWNDTVKKLPKAKLLNAKRQRNINAVLKDIPLLTDWKLIMSFLDNDPFYSGANDRSWRADIDFILQSGKGINILEKLSSTVVSDDDSWKDKLFND